MESRPRRFDPVRLTGFACGALALVANPWVVALLLSADRRIDEPSRVAAIIVGELVLLGVAALLLGRRDRLRGRLVNVGLLASVTLACLVGLELALRVVAGGGQANPEGEWILRENPHGTGSYRLRPDLDLTTEGGGYTMRIRTNRYGMHWRDVAIERTRPRVAFLGDSFTFGLMADSVEASFVGVFDTLVADLGIETLNFGVPGYGLPDILLQLEEDVLRFAPDYLVVAMYVGNDFVDTYLGADKYRLVRGTAVIDSAVLRAALPELPPAAEPARVLRSWESLATFRLFAAAVDRIAGSTSSGLSDFRPSDRFTAASFWSRTEYPEEGKEALRRVEHYLGRIADVASAAGIELIVCTLPYRAQLSAREATGEDYDISLPQRHVERFAQARGIRYLDLAPDLRRAASDHAADLFAGADQHFNNRGHFLVGASLASYFRDFVAPAAPTLQGSTHGL